MKPSFPLASLARASLLACGLGAATLAVAQTAPPPGLPGTLAWSAYDVGSGGYNQAVAIGNALKQRYGVNLRVLPLITRDPRALLDAGEADLAVGFFPEVIAAIVAQGGQSHLRHARLYDTRYVCAMRKGHALARRALTLDAFCNAHHLLVSFSGEAHGFTDEALAGLNRQRRIVLTVNQFFTASRVVAHSDLLTVLPEGFAESAGFGPELVTRELPLALAPVQVEMVWHLRHDVDPAHRWLREQMLAAAA